MHVIRSAALVLAALVAAPAMAAPAKPRPSQSLTLINARGLIAGEVVVTAEGRTIRLANPLSPGGRATLRLPRLKGCLVSINAIFEDEATAEISGFDVCREKTLRFVD